MTTRRCGSKLEPGSKALAPEKFIGALVQLYYCQRDASLGEAVDSDTSSLRTV